MIKEEGEVRLGPMSYQSLDLHPALPVAESEFRVHHALRRRPKLDSDSSRRRPTPGRRGHRPQPPFSFGPSALLTASSRPSAPGGCRSFSVQPPAAPTPVTCSTECLTACPPPGRTASAPSRKISSFSCCRSFPRASPFVHACSLAAGATSGSPCPGWSSTKKKRPGLSLPCFSSAINAEKISCQSLRHLSMDACSFPLGVRTHISCPSLAALELTENVGLTPFLESMPSLVTAFVRFDTEWYDREEPYDHCLTCDHIDSEGDDCVLLDGLCGATDLKLISSPKMIICTRDFKWRHIFSKLKTLYLSEWCLAADFSGLVYFLQHSPILEKLTLGVAVEICEEESLNIQDDIYKPSKQFPYIEESQGSRYQVFVQATLHDYYVSAVCV